MKSIAAKKRKKHKKGNCETASSTRPVESRSRPPYLLFLRLLRFVAAIYLPSSRLRVFAALCLPAFLVTLLCIASPEKCFAAADDHPPAGPGETDVGWDDRVGRELMNLGPIGVRGYLDSDKGFPMHYIGDTILVRKVFDGSPAAGKLQDGDVIVGVNQRKLQPPDCQFMIAEAILAAEGSDGRLSLQVNRAGQTITVPIELPRLGKFAPTAPFLCSKSQLLLKNACDWIVTQQQPDGGWTLGGGTITADICCLTLLGSGDAKYLPVCKKTIEWMLANKYEAQGWNWHLEWNAIFLAEYFLDTGDRSVLPALQEIQDTMMAGQLHYPPPYENASGGFGHSPWTAEMISQLKSPKINIPGAGYNELNLAALQNIAALGMMKQCGVRLDTGRLELAVSYLKKCSDVAPGICYSNWMLTPNPVKGVGTETGFNPTYSSIFAIGLSLLGEEQSFYCRRAVMWACNPANDVYTPFGHAEHHFGMFWTPAAMARLNPLQLIRYTRDMQDYYTLCRMYDGSFTTLPSHEEFVAKGSVGREFGRPWSTGWQGLILALGTGRLHLAGGLTSMTRVMSGPLKSAAQDMEQGRYALAWIKLKRLVDAETKASAGHSAASTSLARQEGNGAPAAGAAAPTDAGASVGSSSESVAPDPSPPSLAGYMLQSIADESAREFAELSAEHDAGDVYKVFSGSERFLLGFGSQDPNAATVKQWHDQLRKDPAAQKEIEAGGVYYQLLESMQRMKTPAQKQRSLKNFTAHFPGSMYARLAESELEKLGPP